jgi:hypothetical protein
MSEAIPVPLHAGLTGLAPDGENHSLSRPAHERRAVVKDSYRPRSRMSTAPPPPACAGASQ